MAERKLVGERVRRKSGLGGEGLISESNNDYVEVYWGTMDGSQFHTKELLSELDVVEVENAGGS